MLPARRACCPRRSADRVVRRAGAEMIRAAVSTPPPAAKARSAGSAGWAELLRSRRRPATERGSARTDEYAATASPSIDLLLSLDPADIANPQCRQPLSPSPTRIAPIEHRAPAPPLPIVARLHSLPCPVAGRLRNCRRRVERHAQQAVAVAEHEAAWFDHHAVDRDRER